MKAREIMTSNPFTVMSTDTVARAAEAMRDLQVGCVPVADDPRMPVLLGLITDRDIAVRCVAEKHGSSCLVRNHMTAQPLQTVGPDSDVDDVARKMEDAQVRRIPVVDAAGRLLGIIAQADLATKLGPREPLIVEEVLERLSSPAGISVI